MKMILRLSQHQDNFSSAEWGIHLTTLMANRQADVEKVLVKIELELTHNTGREVQISASLWETVWSYPWKPTVDIECDPILDINVYNTLKDLSKNVHSITIE